MSTPRLGTIEASEGLLTDLYIDLRTKVNFWSSVTKQTPQARMGYVGQHLVSVVTGFPGGRSGARGYDLVLPDGKHAEIKTCSRVDQLGSCASCSAGVSSIESSCPVCASTEVNRKDDSKWLISIKDVKELRDCFKPEHYYLVLFDYKDLDSAADIQARIWRVSSMSIGFVYCMIDYYFNIKKNAPFNLWPDSLKFHLMRPELIYSAEIAITGTIKTHLFPKVRGTVTDPILPDLSSFASTRSENLPSESVKKIAIDLGVRTTSTDRRDLLIDLESSRKKGTFSEIELVDTFIRGMYWPRIKTHKALLP